STGRAHTRCGEAPVRKSQVHPPGGHQDLLALVFVASTGCGRGLDATVFEGSATSRFRSTLPLATEPTFAFMASSMFSMACLEILSENSCRTLPPGSPATSKPDFSATS